MDIIIDMAGKPASMYKSFIKEDTVFANIKSTDCVYVYVAPIIGWQGANTYGVRYAYGSSDKYLTHSAPELFDCLFDALEYCQALSDANKWENMSWAGTAKTSVQVDIWHQQTELIGA